MKAVIYAKYGGPEVLQYTDVPVPEPGPGEIQIRNHATVASPPDCANRSGIPRMVRLFSGLTKPKNPILGDAVSGEVTALDSDVEGFKVGDKVFGSTCITMGAYAQYNVMKATEALVPLPDNMSFGEAAAVCDGGITALPFLREAGNIKAGDKILINGASGSVGSFAVQLAKYFGAEVTGTCGEGNRDMVLSLGADYVIDYRKEDFCSLRDSFDIIFDAVGKSSFSKCRRALKDGGIYLTTVPDLNILWHMLTTSKKSRKRARFEATGLREAAVKKEDYLFLNKLMEDGKLKTVIDRTYTLQQMEEAHRYVETGHKKGNVVIQIED